MKERGQKCKEPEEEEEEENEAMEDDDEDDAEVINPYEEADPHNRPPPASDEETEFAPPVSSASRDLLEGNDEVCVLGPMPCDMRSVHRGVKRLSKQMHDRYKTEKRMAKILRQEELCKNGQAFDITALDSAEEPSIHIAPVPRADDPYVMVRDAARGNREDEDVDTAAPWDTQPPESHGSLPIRDERERVRREATRAEGPVRDPVTAPIARECSFVGFMKCGPTQFHGTEGAVGLVCWFEKMENTFEISECVEVRKVKFATTTLHGRALTWWNSQVATLGANQTGVAPKRNRYGRCHFHQCPTRCENYGKIGHKAKDCRGKNVAPGAAGQPNIVCYSYGERGHKSSECPKKADQRGGNMQGQAYVIRDAEHNQGPN
nr:putative zinc finger, CCHC-type, retrotransposon Gag domain protein [Tanacetum cinerariifolium]